MFFFLFVFVYIANCYVSSHLFANRGRSGGGAKNVSISQSVNQSENVVLTLYDCVVLTLYDGVVVT